MKRLSYLLLLGAAALCACMEKEDEPPHFVHVESVKIDVLSLELRITTQQRLTCTVYPSDAGNKDVTWYSRDPEIVSVSSAGLVEGLAIGKTVIGVQTSDMRRTDEIEVEVVRYVADIPMTSLALDKSSHAFRVEDDAAFAPITLAPSYEPADASEPVFRWSSSDPSVAAVDDKGVVTPVGYGRASIRIEALDGSDLVAESTVTVNGVRDRNYYSGEEYYKKYYRAVNITVTGSDGQPALQTWLDRNLGADRVAEAMNDYRAYGSMFQWSRKADGHEKMAWTATNAGALVHTPGEVNARSASRADAGSRSFIPTTGNPTDWATEAATKHGLWGGTIANQTAHAPLGSQTDANNPCPAGYRLPTVREFLDMATAVTGKTVEYNKQVAVSDPRKLLFESPLRLPSAGNIGNANGKPTNTGSAGFYWTNMSGGLPADAVPAAAVRFYFSNAAILVNPYQRSFGYAVRCIRDTPLPTTDLTVE